MRRAPAIRPRTAKAPSRPPASGPGRPRPPSRSRRRTAAPTRRPSRTRRDPDRARRRDPGPRRRRPRSPAPGSSGSPIPSISSPARRAARHSAWRRPVSERGVSKREPCSEPARLPSLSPWRTNLRSIRLDSMKCASPYHPHPMRTVARDFPEVVGAISDDGVRALFSQRFLVATEIYDELVDAACRKILDESGGLSARAGLPAHTRTAFDYLVEKLSQARPPSESVEALSAELAATEPDAAVGAEIVSLLAAEAPDFFRGRKSGEDILFSPACLPLWIRYFSNAIILDAINNTLGAETLARVLPSAGADVLEIGGGCGSAADGRASRAGVSPSSSPPSRAGANVRRGPRQ